VEIIKWTKDDGRYGHLATFLVDIRPHGGPG